MRKKVYTKEELSQIIKTYTPSLVRLAFTYTKNIPDAEDIVQEVMIKLITKKPKFENEIHEKAWLIRVTIHTSLNYIKATKRRGQIPLTYDIPEFEKDEYGLLEALEILPDKYKAVMYLYYYEGYSVKEIAQILHRQVSTITTWMSRGRKKLKDYLEKEGV
ncbi:MAG: RNA polymerase sigma factor [Floccifex porci]|uniref:RNA polymerase sigma factor n=1 Tax=Bacillota TaxID=1239 RepID=UPI00095337BE|nr:RNA polymerase sigma factor [Anaerostipes sp. 992a]OLR63170.1 hypothetical protein BHF69_11005 [Anaerostipes sp. 992a]